MQNKWYTKQFFLPPNDWLCTQPPSSTHGTCGFLPSRQPPFINWAWCPWSGIFPLASLGSLPGCAPSQLFYTCSVAEHGKLKKGP